MPDDLIGRMVGPTPPSTWWLWLAGVLIAATVLWYLAVLWWTAPDRSRPEASLIDTARTALLRRRTLRALDDIEKRLHAGQLSPAATAGAFGAQLRRYLHDATGVRTDYLQVPDLAAASGGRLAPAAPLLADLEDLQFNAHPAVDIGEVGTAVRELVRQWT